MKAPFFSLLFIGAIVCSPPLDAAEIIWTNAAGGNWSAAGNWSPNQIPTSVDLVLITNVGSYTVILDGNSTISGFRLGGSLGVQTLIVGGVTLTVNGPVDIGASGFLSLLSGTVGAVGDISVEGLLNAFGGSFAGNGLLSIQTNGQVQLNGNLDLGGRAIDNSGQLFWTTGDLSNGRAITNTSNGVFEILVTSNNIFSCSQACANLGIVRRQSGNSTVSFDFPFSNAGALQVQSGTLQLLRGGNHTGTFNVSSGATLFLGNNAPSLNFHFLTGSTVGGEGNVIFGVPGSTVVDVSIDGVFNLTGSTTIGSHYVNFGTGYTLNKSPLTILGGVGIFNSGRMLYPSSLTVSGGTLSGGDSMTVTGMVTLSSGTLSGGGAINMVGGLTLPGNVTVFSGVLNNAATATLSGSIRLCCGSVLNNLAGATFNYASGSFGVGGPPGRFNNAGLVIAMGPGGIDVPFYNDGAVEIQSGTFSFSEGGTHTGSFQVDGGATLQFGHGSVGAPHQLLASSRIVGQGNIELQSVDVLGTIALGGNVSVTGGTNSIAGTYTNAGALSISAGTIAFNTGGPIDLAQVILSGGVLAGSDPVNVAGAIMWTGGTLVGAGPINTYGSLTIGGGTLILNGGELNNFGSAIWNSGSIFTGSGSVISNAPMATFDITFDGETFAGFGGTRTLFNAGLFRKRGGTGSATVRDSLYNTGTIKAESGVLAFGSTFIQTEGTTFLAGGNLAASGPLQIQGGTLAGSGTIAANVVNSGQCSPGASPGLLKINGDYTQTSSGRLDIELAGTAPGSSFDQLQISGSASLSGALNASAINGFHPGPGESFRILTFASRAGEFSSFNNFTTAPLTRVYDGTGLNLTVSNAPPTVLISRQGQQVVVNWPSTASDYILQGATNLPSMAWIDLTSGTNSIIISPVQQKQFFRLYKP